MLTSQLTACWNALDLIYMCTTQTCLYSSGWVLCVYHTDIACFWEAAENGFLVIWKSDTLCQLIVWQTLHNRHNFGQVIKHGLPSWNCTAVCKEHFCFSWRKLWRPIKGAWIFSPSVSTPAGFELWTSDPVGENHSAWPPATCRLCLPERKAFASFIQTLPASKVSQAQSFTSYPVWLPRSRTPKPDPDANTTVMSIFHLQGKALDDVLCHRDGSHMSTHPSGGSCWNAVDFVYMYTAQTHH